MAYVSLDSEQIKKANKKHKYTKEQVLQLEKCMNPKTGPLYFMKTFMKIQHPVKGEMPFEPFPYQERLIESYNNHRFSIAMLPSCLLYTSPSPRDVEESRMPSSA